MPRIEGAKAAQLFYALQPSHHPCTTVDSRLQETLLAGLPTIPQDYRAIQSAEARRDALLATCQVTGADWVPRAGLPGTLAPLRWSPALVVRAAGSTENRARP